MPGGFARHAVAEGGCRRIGIEVELFAHRTQVQERLTKQVTDWLTRHLSPRGVGVVIEAEHLCMTLRGVQAVGATTITSALSGARRDDARSRAEFFALAPASPRADPALGRSP